MYNLIIRKYIARIRRGIMGLFFTPKVQISNIGPLVTLGSKYGGWTLFDDPKLVGSTVICAGLGEDASFDVEFANRYQANVVIVDPTPRAIEHFDELQSRMGLEANVGYSNNGCQPTSSYNLKKISRDQIILIDKALWINNAKIKFFEPPDPTHVSHSINNFQNGYAYDTPFIEVESITLKEIISHLGLNEIKLLKLDIEGAEIDVLKLLLDEKIYPGQLLIEFDELMLRTRKAMLKWRHLDYRLREAGYCCGHFDGRSCFLYVLSDRNNQK